MHLFFLQLVGKGLNGVATAVEFTFVPHGADFYDISIINGFNIGIEMLGYLDSFLKTRPTFDDNV